MTKIAAVMFLMLHTVFCGWVFAQKLAPLPVEDAINTRSFGQFVMPMKFSPNGEWLAYVVTDNRRMVASAFSEEGYARTGLIWSAVGADIWVANVKTGRNLNITQGVGNNWFPVWSPDARFLAFLSDRDGSSQAKLWLWEANSGTLKKISDVRIRTGEQMQWLPDGKGILVTVLPNEVNPENYLRKSHNLANSDEGRIASEVRVYKSTIADQSGDIGPKSDPWALEQLPVDLAIIDIGGGPERPILRSLGLLGWYLLSPDGKMVAFSSRKRFEKPGSQQILWDIDITTVAPGQQHSIALNVRLAYGGANFSWSPDSSRLAYQATGLLETRSDCYIVDIKRATSAKVTMFPSEGPINPLPPIWDFQGKYLYLVRLGVAWRVEADQSRTAAKLAGLHSSEIEELATNADGTLWSPDQGRTVLALTQDPQTKRSAFYKIDVKSGSATDVIDGGRCYTCTNSSYHVVGSSSGSITYFSEDAQHPPELWLSGADFSAPRQLTHLNSQFDEYVMGKAQLLTWSGNDGEQLQGALLLPAGYQRGRRYPVITWVYGGASLSDHLFRFGLGSDGPFNLQLLATRGYAVLLPDAPQHLGTPMADLAKTVLPGINKLIEIGVADPDRIGVMGHSYGGYSTLGLLVQTDRFKAAVVSAGYGDLIAHYGGMSISGGAFGTSIDERGQGLMGGSPWQFRERYIENSPIFYLDKINAPILIIQGTADTSVLPFLADELFVDLRRLGKDVEYAKYTGEEHTPIYWSYEDQIDVANRYIAWFNKHLNSSAVAQHND